MVIENRKVGRPSLEEKKKIPFSIRLDPLILEKLNYEARLLGVHCREHIRDILEQHLSNGEPYGAEFAKAFGLSALETDAGDVVLGGADKLELRRNLLLKIVCEQIIEENGSNTSRRRDFRYVASVINGANKKILSLYNKTAALKRDLLRLGDIRAKELYEAEHGLLRALKIEEVAKEQARSKGITQNIMSELIKLIFQDQKNMSRGNAVKVLMKHLSEVIESDPSFSLASEDLKQIGLRLLEKTEAAVKRAREQQ